MTELYWLSRFDMISGWFFTLAIISGGIIIISIVGYFCAKSDYIDHISYSTVEEYKRWYDFWKGSFKYSIPSFTIFLICSILTPTSKEAYMIYGVGSTIDYLRNDTTAVKLPHKAIEALDLWVDKLTPKENN